MSKFIRFAMKNAGVIFLSMLLIIGGGIYSRASMKMEEMPNIDIPYLSVVVVYPGATPEQSLEDVGKPMEQALSNLKGIKNIYMSAANDYVAATLEFELGKPVDEAERDINSALATVKLPDSAQKPRVSAQGPNAMPIYSFGVTADADQATIQQYVNDKIKPALVAVPGIAKIDVQGTSEKNLYIKVDPEKLSKENLTLDNVKQALLANNVGVPAGQLTLDGKDLNVEVRKKINSVDDAKKIDLVVVKQDMSSLTDAFKSVGDGFGQVGSSMGKIGQGVGNLTKGQLLLQAQIQLVQGISGLTTQLATEQASLSALNEQLQMAKSNPQKAAAIQGQIAQLNQAIPKQRAQLNQLEQQLAGLQAQVQASGSDTVNVLQSLGGQSAPTTKSDASVTPELNVRTIKLGDIADISYASGKDSMITRLNGKSAVVTDITAEPGTNVVDVVKQINEKLDGLKLPAGYKLTKLRDSSVQVQKSVNTMQREAILGALFAMLITFIFLRNLRSTIVAILAIPLSIFASLIVLYLLDYSLNIMTLAGIAVAVGRVVDDSIVVLENIYRRVRSSESRDRELIVYAAKEVGQAVTSSTITTVAVFTPLMFVPGMVGRFFKPFGITVIVSLIFSLLVAITVVPLLSRLFLLNIKHREPRENALQKGYRSLLNWSLNHKLVIVVLAAALIGGSLTLVTKVPQNFLPSEKTASYALTVTMPVGTATTKTDGIANRLEDVLHNQTDVKSYQTNVRGETLAMQIELKDDVTLTDTKNFEKMIHKATDNLGPDVVSALTPISMASGYGGLYMIINGPDLDSLRKAGDTVVNGIKGVPGLVDVKSNLSAVRPQVSVDVDPAKAAKQGLNPAMVGMALRQMIDGDNVMNVSMDGRSINVVLGLKVDNLNNLDIIRKQKLTNMTGEKVQLSDVANVSLKPGPSSIDRLNQQEYVSVTGRFTSDNSSQIQKQVEDKLKTLKLPQGVSYYFEGESKAMGEGFTNLGIAMIVAVVLVYMVMMVAFGEMLAPMAILFSLPFIFVGGMTGLYLSGESLGVPAMVGFLMLIGIVVTNAIVFIDRVMQNRKSEMEVHEALVEAGVVRLRPILMTAVATVCALLPLAVSQEGGLISRSLAIVVISGLATSTLLTLVIVPVAYMVLNNVRNRVLSLGQKRQPSAVETPAK